MNTTLWINKLSPRALTAINSHSGLNKISQLKYIESPGKLNVILERFSAGYKLNIKTKKVDIDLGDKRSVDGQILLVKAVFLIGELVGIISNNIWTNNDLSQMWPNKLSIPRVRNYLERCIEEEINEIVYLATYLLWLQDQNKETRKNNIILVPINSWGEEIKLYMKELGLDIHVFDDRSDRFIVRLIHIIKILTYTLGYTIIHIIMYKNIKRDKSNKYNPSDNNRYKMSVPYRRSINPEERNDLFWYKNSVLNPERIIISLESSAYPFENSDLKLIQRQGLNAIVRGKKDADLTGLVPVWKSTKRMIIMDINWIWFATKTLLFSWRNWEFFWQWRKLVKLMKQVNNLQAYYESENIGVDIGIDSLQMSAIRAIAMDNVGGVRMGTQWSSVELKSSFLSKNDNIYFCWGKNEEQNFSETRACIDTLIITGYIYDRYIEQNRSKAKKLREQLTINGALFIVTLFDSRIDKNYATVEDMECFYQLFLNECLNDQTFGLIIKSKDSGFLKKMKNVESLINVAKATGRCLVLEEESEARRNLWHINNMFTFFPAMASDLTVSFSISTAGTESALAGARAIYYDHMKQPDHPYYANGGKDRLVFDNLKELIVAIRRYRKGEILDLGDHTPILDEIDPFRDGKAGERIGTYIRWFLDKLNAGCDRKEAINLSNHQYAAKWGADKIIKLN